MLGVTKLLCETSEICEDMDSQNPSPRLLQFSRDKRPVVVWNITRRCNLRCIHCYSDSTDQDYPWELTTEEGIALINDLAAFKTPVIIFSGGDPLLREDIFYLASYSRNKGIRCALSVNGTLIDRNVAKRIKEAGFAYVGVSIDGVGEVNDSFRGVRGAYEKALQGMRFCREEDIRVGIRFTLSKKTIGQLPLIFDLAEKEDIPRLYVSHLVYSGRGERIKKDDLSHEETRMAVDYIFDRTLDFWRRDIHKDILTGNNDTDGVYLYLRVKRDNPQKAEKVYKLLKMRGGNSSGVAIGCVDSLGFVHADQFWFHYSFGNVKERPFSEIYQDISDPLMKGLKNKMKMVKGRCRLCEYLEICGGNYRVRAEVMTGDVWASDPACYLTDEEIGIYEDSRFKIQDSRF
ncbi:MAG: radical SAM protein [Deltaproteobacteria bacterium]|nr:radical SAM protein [Deltaproteobacteria bacterium]